MADIDLVLYGALLGVALTMIGPFWRRRGDNPAGWAGVGLFAAVAAFAALRAALSLELRPLWIIALQIVAVSGPFWFWRLSRTLFEDGFRPRPWHWALLAALELVFLARTLAPPLGEWALAAGRALAAGIVTHALWMLWRGRSGDMMEARLKARSHVIALAGALALLTLARPLLAAAAPLMADVLARVTPVFDILLIALAGRTFFRLERDLWPPRPPRAAPTAAGVDPDAEGLARLDHLMLVEKVWREPGLTVAQLAERTRLPEYRLRRFILERRGARNFSAYLAEHRLADAAARLADPAQARTPITTIAYDCGFASLGPFNRAFRERFGVTPTAFRRGERMENLPRAPAESSNPASIQGIGDS